MIPAELREDIDRIDNEIVKLFSERMAAAAKIAEYKKANALPVHDAAREREKLASVTKLAPEELRGYVTELYLLMFGLSKKYQAEIIGSACEK